MRTFRSRALCTLVLLTLALLCLWSKSEAGSLVARNPGAASTGSSVLVPGTQPTSGDPDTPGSQGSSMTAQGSEGLAPTTLWWSSGWAGWAHLGWIWLRVVGH